MTGRTRGLTVLAEAMPNIGFGEIAPLAKLDASLPTGDPCEVASLERQVYY